MEKLNTTLGRQPKNASTKVGIQGNMAVVQNMLGIIATEVGCGLGVAMQNAAKAGPMQADGTRAGEDTKPYTQGQVTTLLGFHGAMNVKYLMKMRRLFKMAKMANYNHLRQAIKGKMIWWANRQRCWIKEGVYFDNESLNEWIDSTALYSSAKKGITILISLTAMFLLAGEKVLFDRYVFNFYIGIVHYILRETKTRRAKIYLPTQCTNWQILTSAKKDKYDFDPLLTSSMQQAS
jgi:hypothetical protein